MSGLDTQKACILAAMFVYIGGYQVGVRVLLFEFVYPRASLELGKMPSRGMRPFC